MMRYALNSQRALGSAEVLGLVAAAADLVNGEGANGALGRGVDAGLLGAAALAHDALALLVQDAGSRGPPDLGRLLLLQEQALRLQVDEVADGAIARDVHAAVPGEDRVRAEAALNRPVGAMT